MALELKRKFRRMSRVYLDVQEGRAMVSSMFNHGGLFAEKPDGVLLLDDVNAASLGELVIDRMADCTYATMANYSGRKPSDWPAYQASGLKTIKRFEEVFKCYLVMSANEQNIIWNIESPQLEGEMTLRKSVGMINEAFTVGIEVLRVHRRYLKVRYVI